MNVDTRNVLNSIDSFLYEAAALYQGDINFPFIVEQVEKTVFDGITSKQLEDNIILAVAQLIEKDEAYSYLAARLMHNKIFNEVVGYHPTAENKNESYKRAFVDGIHQGVESGLFDKRLLEFDLHELASHLQPQRDDLLQYIGVRILYNRYLKRDEKSRRYELVQAFWMRVAMGLAIESPNKNKEAIEFYNAMSQLHYVPSTPTLLHAGLVHSQLSSCYLTYVGDDLHHIFKCMGDNAQLSKWSGGVANAWTALRGTNALIKSIGIGSQGTIPFLKIANDTTAAINRSGSRRGAVCAYMEVWHIDYEDFLDLRRNTGDERRRTHDMNTASWIPDLFMKRVLEDGNWTMFSPEEAPDLNETYGKVFEALYVDYEKKAARGEIRLFKTMPAKTLWRKMLTRLFETGHPWMTYKDACNIRSPQDHAGVIHSSNLCTEITLNTSVDETAVCNLGSVNLACMIAHGKINEELVEKTVSVAMKMLDNVIDINFYPTKEARVSNERHRPVGLGIMGLQDAIAQLGYAFDSDDALEFSDEVTELISYHAILGSSKIAKEKGAYSSFKGSKWDKGIFPFDTIALLEQERGMAVPVIGKMRKDWTLVKEHVKQYGLRNSNTMAVAPTATISNIAGCFPCIEPIYKNLYAKANSSGDFSVSNRYLERELKELGLWSEEIQEKIKYFDGSIQQIPEIPAHIKHKYRTAFELDTFKMLEMTAARGKWIDQSQSHNVFMAGVSGKKLHDVYMYAWQLGLKTQYYLRTLGATQIEKSTLDAKKYGFTQMREYDVTTTTANSDGSVEMKQVHVTETVSYPQEKVSEEKVLYGAAVSSMAEDEIENSEKKECLLTDPDCESCQ